MKTATLLLMLITSTATITGPKSTPEQIEKELLAIEQDVIKANETCDRAAFERIEASEFIFTSSSGEVTTRQEDLDGMKDCHPKQLDAELSDIRVQVHGDMALLNAKLTETLKKKDGTPVRASFRFTDVFVWRDGRWQMVAGHSSRIPQQP